MSRCSAHNRQGQPCGRQAMAGSPVCDLHGGKSPGARQKAAQRLAEGQARQVLNREGIVALEDPLRALQELAGEALRLRGYFADRLAALEQLRYEGRAGEQLRAEVSLYERALDRAQRFALDLARLDLDGRLVKISEQQAAVIAQVLQRALERLGLYRDDVRVALADELRTVGSAEPFGTGGSGGRLG
jgi:hypothetical protein